MKRTGFAAVVATVLLVAGCATPVRTSQPGSRAQDSDGRTHARANTGSALAPGTTTGLTGGCAAPTSLDEVIFEGPDQYIWALGSLKDTGSTELTRAGRQLVYTKFIFTPTTPVRGSEPKGSVAAWAPGGRAGPNTTTTESLDFATAVSGDALVSLFRSDNFPGDYEFDALPVEGDDVLMVTLGCWIESLPVAPPARTRRLSAGIKQALAKSTRVEVIRYHDGVGTRVSVQARRIPLSVIKTAAVQPTR